jgi:hypothetical protein
MGMASVILLGLAALIVSGSLFKQRRVLTYLATAGALFEGAWLGLTLLERGGAGEKVWLAGAVILLGLSVMSLKKWKAPWQEPGSGQRDGWVIGVLLVVGLAAYSVVSYNGFQANAIWVTYGFYNGDTATLAALVNKSFMATGLVQENPFAGNEELEYPSLLHAGLANLLAALGKQGGWLHFLPLLTLVQIAITIPLFWLIFDLWQTEPAQSWENWWGVPKRWVIQAVQAGLVLGLLGVAWDNYIYPQSHFFLTALFLLMIALLGQGYGERNRKQLIWLLPAVVLAVVLLLANAVTGTAAAGLVVVFAGWRLLDNSRGQGERLLFLGSVLAVTVLFMVATPGEPAFGWRPGFSYTAANDMVRLAPWLIILIVGALQSLKKQAWLVSSVAALLAMAWLTFIFSSRNIVVENASRFLYHALLIGFPLLLAPLIAGWYWLRRELVQTSHAWPTRLSGWLLVFGGVGSLLLPMGQGVVSAHDNLWRKDKQTVSLLESESLNWIKDNTAESAIFAADPQSPWAIPYFTGRAILRSDYWLSPDDLKLQEVREAFAGSGSAQELVLKKVDYLYLRKREKPAWEPLKLEEVFANEAVTIYKAR